jgi:acetylornithine deacetylase/succinyl-diaminopimelate desuccinylase-like protein
MTPEQHLAAGTDWQIETLRAFCRIPSVSTDPAFAPEMHRAAEFVADLLRTAGLDHVEIAETGGHPAILADWLHARGAPTVLVYGHYDVQPPEPLDRWQSPPFEPTIRDGRLYARGVADDKGPLLVPILVVEALLAREGRLPVNVKFLIEGEEEVGSAHLGTFVAANTKRLAADVVVSADGAMWRVDLPTMTVASRGICAIEVKVRGAVKDLHSGRHGGSAPNPLHALATMVASLHGADGRVSVAGFHDGIRASDPALRAAIVTIGFDAPAYYAEIGAVQPAWIAGGSDLLERQWLEPTLELNGLWGGYQGPGSKTVIPTIAQAKITCRLVPGQEPGHVVAAVAAHLRRFCPSGCSVEITADEHHAARAYAIDPANTALAAAEAVLGDLYGRQPLRVAMGATLPIAELFQRVLGLDTVFFSFATADEDYHAPNEFFRLDRFRDGLSAWTSLLRRLGTEVRPAGASLATVPGDESSR